MCSKYRLIAGLNTYIIDRPFLGLLVVSAMFLDVPGDDEAQNDLQSQELR